MKTAKELWEMARARDDWKHLRLWSWAYDFEAKMHEWNNLFPPVDDDRRVFINTYQLVYDALDSMPDNPNNWVCVACNRKLDEERKMMNDILARFADSTEYGKLVTAEKTCHTIEVREKVTGKTGVANTHPDGVAVFYGADDGSDDKVVSVDDFNRDFEITCMIAN